MLRALLPAGLLALLAAPAPGQGLNLTIGQAPQAPCTGSYEATLIQPLPAPLVISLDIFDNSPGNLALAADFTRGLTEVGVATAGAATARLRLTLRLTGPSGGGGGGGGDPGYSDWGGLQGGLFNQLPAESTSTLAPSATPSAPTALTLRAEARDAGAVDWVGLVSCSLGTQDMHALAYGLGRLVGSALGRTVPTTGF